MEIIPLNWRIVVSLESNVAHRKGGASPYWIDKLSYKVCARPWSAANKASLIFPIASNDFHKEVYVFSYSSRNFIFQLSSDFNRDLTVLKTSTAETKLSTAMSNCPSLKYAIPILWWALPSSALSPVSFAIFKCFSLYSMAFLKSLYWPGMSAQIEEKVKDCTICGDYAPA